MSKVHEMTTTDSYSGSKAERTGCILVVDDDDSIRELEVMALAPLGVRILSATTAEQALKIVEHRSVAIVVCDLRMPGMDGLAFLCRMRDAHPNVRVVLLSGYGNMEIVIQAMRLGAADFITKPFDLQELRAIVDRHLLGVRQSASPWARNATKGEDPICGDCGLRGESPAFLRSLECARKAARTHSPVLVTGESGTGKEGVARLIHATSDRAGGPFIPLNCGALPENLIESELFGHVRGAFTGATIDRPGKFMQANGGTLFLDEIGEMSANMQVRLLRVLQERVVEPVGGGAAVRTDFRLIAATHRDLREEVRAGRFREDLWFRLHVIPVVLPPLRDRERDVLLLARHFLALCNARYGTRLVLSPENERTLLAHSWPGNVRELANAVERAVVLAEGDVLRFELDETRAGEHASLAYAGNSVRGRRRAAEREVILATLEACRWNKTLAAARLGISRRGLLYKVKEYEIG